MGTDERVERVACGTKRRMASRVGPDRRVVAWVRVGPGEYNEWVSERSERR